VFRRLEEGTRVLASAVVPPALSVCESGGGEQIEDWVPPTFDGAADDLSSFRLSSQETRSSPGLIFPPSSTMAISGLSISKLTLAALSPGGPAVLPK